MLPVIFGKKTKGNGGKEHQKFGKIFRYFFGDMVFMVYFHEWGALVNVLLT
jgi:hypothetical protein